MLVALLFLGVPAYLKWYLEQNDRSTIAALPRLADAQETYRTNYGQYAPSLAALGPPPAGASVSAAHANLIDAALAAGARSGFSFTYQASDRDNDGRADSYTVSASPFAIGSSGQAYYFLDESKQIRRSAEGAATASSPMIPK